MRGAMESKEGRENKRSEDRCGHLLLTQRPEGREGKEEKTVSVQKRELLNTDDGNEDWYSQCGKQYGTS
jgi:hypothetical protein